MALIRPLLRNDHYLISPRSLRLPHRHNHSFSITLCCVAPPPLTLHVVIAVQSPSVICRFVASFLAPTTPTRISAPDPS